ncbi:MAG: hypothetical protein ACOYLQ_08240 [Hyphomicrobiaceae bacterium]
MAQEKSRQGATPPELPKAAGGGVAGPPPLPPMSPASRAAEAASPSAAALGAPGPDQQSAGDDGDDGARRSAKRRPAGPSRQRIAANDDAPSIGGLIYALNQKPSNTPFVRAAMASAIWVAVGVVLAGYSFGHAIYNLGSASALLALPALLPTLAAIGLPPFLFYFFAMLVWRADELKMRSSAMTEVAVRLAEPDRMAEQQITSLGQAVRRQVSFMNEAVERALGRAGELEALVHNEIALLDRSYEDNERRIRNLIQELSGERMALATTSEGMQETLRAVGSEVPALIDKLTNQQIKLAKVIEGAGENLTQLETAIAAQTGNIETALGSRTAELKAVVEDYTLSLDSAIGSRTEQLHGLLQGHIQMVGQALDSGSRSIDTSITERTQGLQVVFEEYAKALDTTLANRAQALDVQLIERTKALDSAFNDRLRLFDESILRSTNAIDSAVGDTARALTSALEHHAKSMSETIGRQAVEIDETLINGITAVRRTSENITRQSLKAIEGLAGQADMLKSVSENLLSQISQVTNRFETQGHTIMRAANALESANYKIDATLQHRQSELGRTLERLSGKADDLGRVFEGYSTNLEGSIGEAERRARQLAEDLTRTADQKSRQTLAEIEQLKIETTGQTDRALDDLRNKFTNVSREVTERLGTMTSQFDESSQEMRERASRAATDLANEQARLRDQMSSLPAATRESTETMRRALQDQLRALEQLSSLTSRESARRDVAPPAPRALPPPPREDRSQALNSLTSTLAQEMAQRQRTTSAPTSPPPAQPAQAAPAEAAGDPRDGWSLGDLLKRASREEEGGVAAARVPAGATNDTGMLALDALSRCLDPATATAIWNRFRSGQRGFMVRSIYSEEGRGLFDDVARRYRTETTFQQNVNRYLLEFEGALRQAEARDPSGQLVQAQLVSEMGRAYLLLAHASGRLT